MASDREKMLAGQLYNAQDGGLVAERRRARALTRRFNATVETEPELREAILRDLLGRLGANPEVEPPFYCDYGSNIEIGDFFYANFGCVILDCARVSIGHHAFLAPYVQIYAAHHPLDARTRNIPLELASPVTIGDNVWIGGGAIVNPGVTIGNNVVIGSGSVVVRDIPDNVVAVGNPCRPVREIAP